MNNILSDDIFLVLDIDDNDDNEDGSPGFEIVDGFISFKATIEELQLIANTYISEYGFSDWSRLTFDVDASLATAPTSMFKRIRNLDLDDDAPTQRQVRVKEMSELLKSSIENGDYEKLAEALIM